MTLLGRLRNARWSAYAFGLGLATATILHVIADFAYTNRRYDDLRYPGGVVEALQHAMIPAAFAIAGWILITVPLTFFPKIDSAFAGRIQGLISGVLLSAAAYFIVSGLPSGFNRYSMEALLYGFLGLKSFVVLYLVYSTVIGAVAGLSYSVFLTRQQPSSLP